MSAPLDAVRPRLAKLIPVLSSDKPGEVAATVAAIERTLKASGLDWHDLAALVGNVPAPYAYKPAPADAYTRPAPPQPTPKPRRPPSPWPTFSTLRHSERCAWLDAIERGPHSMEKNTRITFAELRNKMVCRPHELLSRTETNLFNRLVKLSWLMGVRP